MHLVASGVVDTFSIGVVKKHLSESKSCLKTFPHLIPLPTLFSSQHTPVGDNPI